MALAVENARLFEEARTRAEELAVLNELGQALTARLNVEEVLEESYRGASRLLDASNFYIGLYDPERNEIALVFNVTKSAQDAQIAVISADQGLSGYIIRNRTSVLLEDNVRAQQEALGIETVGEESLSWLGVPLIVGDQVLGVMAVQSYTTPHAYDEHDRDLLTAIASQAAIAIQSARLFEQTEEALAETRALYEASRAIAEAITIEGILQAIVDHVTTTDVDRCSVLFNNVTTGKVEWMELVATWDRAGIEQGLGMPIGTRIYARQFPIVGLDSKDDPFVVNNTAEDERLGAGMREVIVERMQAQSFAMIPLATLEQGLGTLMIICRSPHAFTERELRLYQSVADRAAIAIENRRLLEATQARARRERLIREITGKVQRSVDLDTILRTTVQELGRALGASHAVVRLGTEAELATPHVEGQTDSDAD
jgi:GAF domain-containing protein